MSEGKIVHVGSPTLGTLVAIYVNHLMYPNATVTVVDNTANVDQAFRVIVVRSGYINWASLELMAVPYGNGVSQLVTYCRMAVTTGLARVFTISGSLSHAIHYVARKSRSDDVVINAFFVLAEAMRKGYDLRKTGADIVLTQDTRFRDYFIVNEPLLVDDYRSTLSFCSVANYWAALYVGGVPPAGIADVVFSKTGAVIIFYWNREKGWAAIRLRTQGWRPPVDLSRVRAHLPEKENWRLVGVGESLLVCGLNKNDRTVVNLAGLVTAFINGTSG